MAYAVLKNNRRTTKLTFNTYESARQFIRKLLRKMGREAYITEMYMRGQRNTNAYAINPTQGALATWDAISRNPTNFTELGYAIRKLD